jgi:Na+/phosphate symporter
MGSCCAISNTRENKEVNMEEKEMQLKFHEVLQYTLPLLENTKKGFFAEKQVFLKESKAKIKDIIRSRVDFAQNIIDVKDKSEGDMKYVSLLPSFQSIGLALENLINKMETKVESRILFSEKALSEIKELFGVMLAQFRDTMDYVITKNPRLKENINGAKETIAKTTAEHELVHQQRLITGVCMPQASYLYIDISESIKRISRGLAEFAEKV